MEILEAILNSDDIEQIKSRVQTICQGIPKDKLCRNSNSSRIIHELKFYNENEKIKEYYFNLLERTLSIDTNTIVHSSFIELLKFVAEDEIDILNKIKAAGGYEFIRTSDLKDHRFFNYQWKKYDFPKDDLKHPEKFDLYIHNLSNRLKLMEWTINKQDAVWDNRVQTGLVQYSNMYLTISGEDFLKSILKDENKI